MRSLGSYKKLVKQSGQNVFILIRTMLVPELSRRVTETSI